MFYQTGYPKFESHCSGECEVQVSFLGDVVVDSVDRGLLPE